MPRSKSPHADPLRFQVWRLRNEGHSLALAVSGQLDISNASAFRGQVEALIEGPASEVSLDLSRCEFMDSSAVNALLIIGKQQVREGRRLVLAGLAPRTRRVLEIAGLEAAALRARPEAYPDLR